MVFTHRFTTFDGRNPASADSEFHGFFNLFWLGVAIFMLQLFLENYQKYGSVLGGNQIVQMMFQRDVMVLVLSSAGVCMTSLFGLILQKTIQKRHLGWNGSGWIIQGVSFPLLWFGVVITLLIGLLATGLGIALSYSCN
jgi:sterol O-acyltransferase